MKKLLLISIMIIASWVSVSWAKIQGISLLNWTILQKIIKIDHYLLTHSLTIDQLLAQKDFVKITTSDTTNNSYAALFNQNMTAYTHPNQAIIGKNLSMIPEAKQTIKVMQAAVKDNACKRGFYINFLDQQNKYMVACPVQVATKDKEKLLYVYTVYTRNLASYQLKNLRSSTIDLVQ